MAYSLNDHILSYLDKVEEDTPARFAPSSEIRSYLIKTIYKGNWSNTKYIAALRYLIGKGYIEGDIEQYRISAIGREYVYRQCNPEPEPPELVYARRALQAQHFSNFLAVIALIVAIIGTIGGISWVRSNKTSRSIAFTNATSISLSQATDQQNYKVASSTLSQWFDQVPGDITLMGIPYELAGNRAIVETESQTSANSNVVSIPINISGVVRIHLLSNMTYGSPRYVGSTNINGSVVCRVWLVSDMGEFAYELIAGRDIREWVIGASDVVATIGGNVQEFWKDHHKVSGVDAVIDHQTLDVPPDWEGATIKKLVVEDRSIEVFNSVNPGIMVFGVTVEYKP